MSHLARPVRTGQVTQLSTRQAPVHATEHLAWSELGDLPDEVLDQVCLGKGVDTLEGKETAQGPHNYEDIYR